MKQLLDLLDSIISNNEYHTAIETSDYDKLRELSDGYFLQFKDFYCRAGRHRYSDITKHLTPKTPDALDLLRDGMNQILEDARSNEYDHDAEEPKNLECYKKLVKLVDHIELETYRLSSIYHIKAIADRANTTYQQSNELLIKSEKNINDTECKAQHLSQQLISILGIFAGIIVTFSFATTVVGDTIANLAKNDIVYLGFAICVLGLVFLNIMAFLMSFITKLSGHTFSKTFPWLIYIFGTISILTLTMFLYFHMK